MSSPPDPQTKAELRDDIDRLVQRAFTNGVTVDDGAYALRHDDPEIPDWELLITRTNKSTNRDESSR